MLEFPLQPLLLVTGLFALGITVALSFQKKFDFAFAKWEKKSEQNFSKKLAALCGAYTLFVILIQILKSQNYRLEAYDFYLFQSMFDFMAKGHSFVTLFAPDVPSGGFTQHGTVHVFYSLFYWIPVVKLLGPHLALLLFNPIHIGGAAFVLGLIIRKNWGSFAGLILSFAFLVSTQVGSILMDEGHPETAYPFWIFLLYFASTHLQFVRYRLLALVSLTFGVLIKEDAFLYFLPLLAGLFLAAPSNQKKWAIVGGVWTLFLSLIQMWAISKYSAGILGPLQIDGQGVQYSLRPGAFEGNRWDGVSSVFQILSTKLSRFGSLSDVGSHWFQLLFSKPWIALWISFPWILRLPGFWIFVLPVSFAYMFINPVAGRLQLYYSAPFVGVLWGLFASSGSPFLRLRQKQYAIAFVFVSVLVLNGRNLVFQTKDPFSETIGFEGTAFANALPPTGQGLTQGIFLKLFPLEKVRFVTPILRTSEIPEFVTWVFLAKERESYLFPKEVLREMQQNLRADPNWVELNRFQEVEKTKLEKNFAFFVRKSAFDQENLSRPPKTE